MKRLNRLMIMGMFGALILALLAIVPASADKPIIERFKFDGYTVFEDCEFPIPMHITGGYQAKAFFDENGEYRGGAHEPWGGTTITLSYNENSLTFHNVETSRWEVVGEGLYTVHNSGLVWGLSVPGYGRAIARSGLTILGCHTEDEEVICNEVIKWSGLEVEDLDVVCNYMLNGK